MKNNEVFTDIFGISKPMIGMVHVKALPGTPGYDAQAGVQGIIEHAVLEAQRLQEGGIDAIQIENQFDKPFLKPEHINYEIVAVITAIGSAIKAAVDILRDQCPSERCDPVDSDRTGDRSEVDTSLRAGECLYLELRLCGGLCTGGDALPKDDTGRTGTDIR